MQAFSEQVTPMLADRLERALHVLKSQSANCKVLVSGGKGPDEPITEALAMQRYLVEHGVLLLLFWWRTNLQVLMKTLCFRKISSLITFHVQLKCFVSQANFIF